MFRNAIILYYCTAYKVHCFVEKETLSFSAALKSTCIICRGKKRASFFYGANEAEKEEEEEEEGLKTSLRRHQGLQKVLNQQPAKVLFLSFIQTVQGMVIQYSIVYSWNEIKRNFAKN